MAAPANLLRKIGCSVLLLLLALPAAAQVEDQLSAYTGDNATGYLQPLADAFGAGLNSGLFRSAYIPVEGVSIAFELKAMGVLFSDDDDMFSGTTEPGFNPASTIDAPTIVGPGEAVIVDGDNGTKFAFPGGFDLSSFSMAVPQLTISSIKGTEAIVRFIAVETGDAELGDISLFGLGVRHSISQYLREDFPVDLAVGGLWQTFTVGENSAGDELISTKALTFGVQASKRLGSGPVKIEPYAGLAIDSFTMEVAYESDTDGDTVLEWDRSNSMHLNFGLALNFKILNLHADYNIAEKNSVTLGLAIGKMH